MTTSEEFVTLLAAQGLDRLTSTLAEDAWGRLLSPYDRPSASRQRRGGLN